MEVVFGCIWVIVMQHACADDLKRCGRVISLCTRSLKKGNTQGIDVMVELSLVELHLEFVCEKSKLGDYMNS